MRTNISLLTALIGLSLISSATAQDGKKEQDDIVQHKDGTLFVGKITTVYENGVEMQLKSGGKVTLEFKNLVGYSVYRIKADRIDPQSALAHFALGEWCLANGLYPYASVEFDKAASLDKDLAERARKKKEEAQNEDARTRFEEAKRLIAIKDYDNAEKILSLLVTTYKDTPWAKEAQAEMAKLAEEIKKENDAKKKTLEDKEKAKAAAAAAKKEDAEKATLQQAVDAFEEAKRQWAEALDWEGKANLTKADRAFKATEARLIAGKRTLELLAKSTDANITKQTTEFGKELDRWLVMTYYRLGRMWAVELNYPEATAWLNKGLRLAPEDHLLNEVLLTLTQLEMRRRAAASKY